MDGKGPREAADCIPAIARLRSQRQNFRVAVTQGGSLQESRLPWATYISPRWGFKFEPRASAEEGWEMEPSFAPTVAESYGGRASCGGQADVSCELRVSECRGCKFESHAPGRVPSRRARRDSPCHYHLFAGT